MGQVLHGCATTTHAVRAAIQRSKAPVAEVAERNGLNRKTVMKWRGRAFVADAPMGPKAPRSTVLTAEEEAMAVAFRKHTLLPLDDCLYALRASIPHLTRSWLPSDTISPACLRWRATKPGGRPSKPTRSATSTSTSPRSGPSRASCTCLWPSTAQASSPSSSCRTAAGFLRRLIEAVPYHVHTVLTDNGTHFTNPGSKNSAAPVIRAALASGVLFRAHSFELACAQSHINHRLTKPCRG